MVVHWKFARMKPHHLALLFVLPVLGTQPPKPQLPPPTGHFKTGVSHIPLTDYSRHDLFAPNSFRKLLVSIYYPTHQVATHQEPYLPALLSSRFESQHPFPNGTLHTILANAKVNAVPILPLNPQRFIFSHGGNTSRLINTVLFEEVASHGYVVIAIDHPYDATVVEFPDGTVIYRDPQGFSTEAVNRWVGILRVIVPSFGLFYEQDTISSSYSPDSSSFPRTYF